MPPIFSISLLSGSIIAYETTLMRLFSIAQWHHFAYVIISFALLGFGASGTMISITLRWLMLRFHIAYTIAGVIYAINVPCCFRLSQSVFFNPFMLVWQPSQMLSILATYLVIAFGFNAVIVLVIGIYLVGGWTTAPH